MVEVRAARPDDDAALRAIDVETWSTVVSPGGQPSRDAPFLEERRRPEDVLVAEDDGAVAGFLILRRSPLPSGAHVVQVNGIATAPAHQRRGVARALLAAAEDVVRREGVRKLTLRVLGPNAGARRLYESCGYRVEGVLREEFVLDGRPVDDVLMAKFLD